jgi:hypothetical protein
VTCSAVLACLKPCALFTCCCAFVSLLLLLLLLLPLSQAVLTTTLSWLT